jgi:hypothetical protein
MTGGHPCVGWPPGLWRIKKGGRGPLGRGPTKIQWCPRPQGRHHQKRELWLKLPFRFMVCSIMEEGYSPGEDRSTPLDKFGPLR